MGCPAERSALTLPASMSEPATPTPEPADRDLSGRQLGDYRLLRRLGRGAMAEVYLAEQCSLNRQVAFKVLKSDLAKDETYVKRFQREAQAAAALVHANIVQIHEVGRIDQVYFIAQEYVQGLNLRQWINRNGTPELRLALIIMRQVAAALSKAAEQGIVHRDVKPENIMLTRSGEVKVADFGLARLAGGDEGVNLTQIGMTMGTPLYMSPEQVEGKSLDPRSDVYAFGVTCYHMLAGAPPFDGETALSVAVQHLKKNPEPLENIRSDLPPALCRVVHRMLAKSPEKRYQHPRELLKELHKLQLEHLDEDWPEDLPGLETAGIELAVTSRYETTRRLDSLMKTAALQQTRRPQWIGWLTAGLAAFLLGGAAAYWTTREPPLLAQTDDPLARIPHYDDPGAQFLYAKQVDTEEAWLAVLKYHGDKTFWASIAKQQLALVYIKEFDDERAMQMFEQLVALEETETEFRAVGLAGQCWLLTRQGDYTGAGRVLAELLPIRSELRDPLMRQMLDQALETIRSKKGPLTIQQWQDWQAAESESTD